MIETPRRIDVRNLDVARQRRAAFTIGELGQNPVGLVEQDQARGTGVHLGRRGSRLTIAAMLRLPPPGGVLPLTGGGARRHAAEDGFFAHNAPV